ncbi:MAG: 30S ribosomal protein S30e [Candidatus Lokiarchaeota archaeon]|nr:30S ribosomal protein S30e [Candidatus Lokiarchaeota archaeon]
MPGSHGSLTKAGKVRGQTPQVPKTGVNSKKKNIPRVRNRNNYIKRIVKHKYAGQATSMGAQKHNRKVSVSR